mmetsp:Transcript_7244/g.16394  ORF Transcript_7244/g.16394 Transcript_7244/m.16394 type:complete len:246 (-) Transcript_7244:99-836(-)
MGQASQGLAARRFCHTQEIAHEPIANEWQSLGQWTSEVEEKNGSVGSECKAAVSSLGASCCATDDGACAVEEVLVVHHDALKKVNFLLRVDELSGCELPSVPECVIAAKRAELQKKNINMAKESSGAQSDEWSPQLNEDGTESDGTCDQSRSSSREAEGPHPGMTARPRPGLARDMGPALQPCSRESFDDEAMWPADLDMDPEDGSPASGPAEGKPGAGAAPGDGASFGTISDSRKPRLPARLPT